MKNIFYILILTLFFSCSENRNKQNETKFKHLQDGWYLTIKDSSGIKRHLTKAPDEIYYLPSKPLLIWSDIKSINCELWTELDSSMEIDFELTKSGKNKWESSIKDNSNQPKFVFILNDSVINFDEYSSGSIFKNPHLTLGYSDYIEKEVQEILNEIKKKSKLNFKVKVVKKIDG